MLLLLHAIISCLCLHAAPCFYAFWYFNPYILQHFTENCLMSTTVGSVACNSKETDTREPA